MLHTVMIIEDDAEVRKYLKQLILDDGYSVVDVADGIKAMDLIERRQPDIVILDLGLPHVSGESVCSDIRRKYPDIPVIILTGKSEVSDIVRGFNLGADDYITKPFKGEELLARIKARLRPLSNGSSILKVADLELNTKTFSVKRGDRNIQLSHKEYELLQYLMLNGGRILTREMILQRVWLTADYIEPRVVDVYIGYLRKKVDFEGEEPLLHTVRGFGYLIKEPNHSSPTVQI